MPLTITEAFDLPSPDEIRALGFVVQLTDADEDTRARRLVDDYVITPGVREELKRILNFVQRTFARGQEVGWFLHGSFGSGKSHLMSYLGFLMEDRDFAWQKPDPLVAELARRHRADIQARRPLVVRLHMLSADYEGSRFDRLVYTATNHALARHGTPPFEFIHVDGILDEARREAAQYGDAFWRHLETAGIVGSRAEFEALAAGDPDDREALARAYLEHKGRDIADAPIDPAWSDGLQRLARHLQAHGYGALVLLVDEMLLWLSGKTGPEFKQAVNQLNTIVDHTDGPRAIPTAVFVARQRRLAEFFPDMVDEEQLHDHIDHHAGRFETTTLDDVELRYICKARVLRRRDPAAVERALDQLADTHGRVLPAILQQGADLEYLRDVYPFHPALIEMLIDISSLMQRDRTALRLLYELLVIHNPDLPLGQLIPVGRAFDAIFPPAGVEGSRRVEHLRAVHSLYHQRIHPTLEARRRDAVAAGDPPDGFTEPRRRILDQLVKTALLAEVSPRLRGPNPMTVERLVLLNDVDVTGETDRGRMVQASQDLEDLARRVPALQVSGTGKSALVSVTLEGADFGAVLDRARGHVDNPRRRFHAFYHVLKPQLGVHDRPGFRDDESNDGAIEVTWRGTRRRGTLALANVRELPYDRFKVHDGEFRLLLDYPWDEPGHTVAEDRERARRVRSSEGVSYSACWLPRHLVQPELDVVRDLSAAAFIASGEGQEMLLANLPTADRQQIVARGQDLERTLRQRLEQILRVIYKDHGEVVPLVGDIATDLPHADMRANAEHLARALLDRRFPQHPHFTAEPRPAELQTLLAWMIQAAETPNLTAAIEPAAADVLRAIGQPLELASIGQTQATLRLDTRYIRAVLERITERSVLWDPIDADLRETYGLPAAVRNLLLAFATRHLSYRVLSAATGDPIDDAPLDARPRSGLRLERAEVLTLAQWSRVRELAHMLLGADSPVTRGVAAQDSLARRLRDAGRPRREALLHLRDGLAHLGIAAGGRRHEIDLALARLKPLADTSADPYQALQDLLAQWPEDADDPVVAVVTRAEPAAAALDRLDRVARDHLRHATDDPAHGPEAATLLGRLDDFLAAADRETRLDQDAVDAWNSSARDLVRDIVRGRAAPTPPPAAEAGTTGMTDETLRAGVAPTPNATGDLRPAADDTAPDPATGADIILAQDLAIDLDDPHAAQTLAAEIRRRLADLPARPRQGRLDLVARWRRGR